MNYDFHFFADAPKSKSKSELQNAKIILNQSDARKCLTGPIIREMLRAHGGSQVIEQCLRRYGISLTPDTDSEENSPQTGVLPEQFRSSSGARSARPLSSLRESSEGAQKRSEKAPTGATPEHFQPPGVCSAVTRRIGPSQAEPLKILHSYSRLDDWIFVVKDLFHVGGHELQYTFTFTSQRI